MLDIGKKRDKKRWKATEKTYLKENAGKLSDKEIAKNLGKSIKAIREMRYRMKIKKKSGRGVIEIDQEKSKL